MKEFQHRYHDVEEGRHVGGVVVSDYLKQGSGALMFGGKGSRYDDADVVTRRLRTGR